MAVINNTSARIICITFLIYSYYTVGAVIYAVAVVYHTDVVVNCCVDNVNLDYGCKAEWINCRYNIDS